MIDRSHAVVVVASTASANSTWVPMELAHAERTGRPVVPLLIEAVADLPPFADWLGIDLANPLTFAEGLDRLVAGEHARLGRQPPPPNPGHLDAGLRALAAQVPAVGPFVLVTLDSEGLRRQSARLVLAAPFHALDEAVNGLFDPHPNTVQAYIAADAFRERGAGLRAWKRWIQRSGDGGLPLISAVGYAALPPSRVDPAIGLLDSCAPPNDHALYHFLDRNVPQILEEQVQASIQLVAYPFLPPGGEAVISARVALTHFPQSDAVQQVWASWITNGCFDGDPLGPRELMHNLRLLQDAGVELPGSIHETLRGRVRNLLRSGNKSRVAVGMDYVYAAADREVPILLVLLQEANGVASTAEWGRWRERAPETADWMGTYVRTLVTEATGTRDWLRAFDEADRVQRSPPIRERSPKTDRESAREI